MHDLRDDIFINIADKKFIAELSIMDGGLVCGIDRALDFLDELDCAVEFHVPEGSFVSAGDVLLRFYGRPKNIALAEDCVIGAVSKPTGIARAAAEAVAKAGGKIKIVAGASKKLPVEIKGQIKHAVSSGGSIGCISPAPFVYLDKNYVKMFGSVKAALEGVAHLKDFLKVVQLKGRIQDISEEARDALDGGAGILMVDTGRLADLESVSMIVRKHERRSEVSLAFAGGVRFDDIEKLVALKVDILDIGRAIIDAPLADCRCDVIGEKKAGDSEKLNLLHKTELRIDGVELHKANLTEVAAAAASTLGLPPDKVAVIDVRPGQLALDVLIPVISAEQFFGREKILLQSLGRVAGVTIAEDAAVRSQGILGAISLKADEAGTYLRSLRHSAGLVTDAGTLNSRARVVVFPTGFELEERHIEDTNTPFICKIFSEAGFLPEPGSVLPDRLEDMIFALTGAAENSRAVITSGGVGAEDKDFSVEAVLALDPEAAAPYIVKFRKGHGRHVKDGIRIAVGEYGACLVAALPGPHDEVRLTAPILLAGLRKRLSKHEIAEAVAERLRAKFAGSTHHGRHHHH